MVARLHCHRGCIELRRRSLEPDGVDVPGTHTARMRGRRNDHRDARRSRGAVPALLIFGADRRRTVGGRSLGRNYRPGTPYGRRPGVADPAEQRDERRRP